MSETVLPAIIMKERAEGIAAPLATGIGKICIVGTANKGSLKTATPISSESDVKAAFGNEDAWNMSQNATKTPLGLVRGLKMALKSSKQITAYRVGSGNEAKASLNLIDTSDNIVAILNAKTEGNWSHNIDVYVEDSTESAIVEDEQIPYDDNTDGDSDQSTFDLKFNNIVKSVSNSFAVEDTNEVFTTYNPVYYKSNTLDYASPTKAKSISETPAGQKIAQSFLTVNAITIDELKASIKKAQATAQAASAVYQEDYNGGSPNFYDKTTVAATVDGAGDVPLTVSGSYETTDAIWIGFTSKFYRLIIDVYDPNTSGSHTIVYKYNQGTSMSTLTPDSDGTNDGNGALEKDGTVEWTPADDCSGWTAEDLNDIDSNAPSTANLYWVKIEVTSAGSVDVTCDQILVQQEMPTGSFTIGVYETDTDGEPTGGALANATITLDTDLTTDYQDISKSLTSTNLNQNTLYAISTDFTGITFNGGTVDFEVIDYNSSTNPYYYSEGKQLYYNGTTWSDTDKEDSLLFQILPIITANQIGVRMRNWDNHTLSTTVASIFFLSALTEGTIHVTYKVSGDNSKVKRVVFKYEGATEEFVSLSGEDLVRDINNVSAGSVWFDAEEGDNPENSPATGDEKPANGTEDIPVHPTGGNNGSEASPTDFDEILSLAEMEDVQIICIASEGRYNKQVVLGHDTDDLESLHAILRTHVLKMEKYGSDRITLVGMRAATATERTLAGVGNYISSGYDSIDSRLDGLADDRLIFTAPGVKVVDPVLEDNIIMSGQMTACLCAGLISSLQGYESPTRQPLPGVVDVEMNLNQSAKEDLAKIGVMVIEKAGYIRILHGITTDSTNTFREISVRRSTDYVRLQLRTYLDAFIGKVNNPDNRTVASSGISGILRQMYFEGYITKIYSVDVHSDRAAQLQGKVNADVRFQPLFPINKFMVNLYVE